MDETSATKDGWPWPDTLDACLAAPQSHRLLFENDVVRVLEVIIEPGKREPTHTHSVPSVMIVDVPARIRYYAGETLTFESPVGAANERRISWLDPEPHHSVENIDLHSYHAYRIELRATSKHSFPSVAHAANPLDKS